MAERRNAQRMRTLRSGKILFNQKGSVLDCVVRNLSDGGACLQVESPVGVPQRFELMIDGESAKRTCDLAWQAGNRIGVRFAQAPSAAQDTDRECDGNRSATMFSRWRRNGEEAPDLLRAELLSLRAALDEVEFGVVLLDAELRAQFINRAFRKMWRLPDAKAEAKPAFVALMYHGRDTRAYEVPAADLDGYVAERVALVKAGDPTPRDLRLASGQVIRFQCAVLPAGGRMLSYTCVTDIVRHSDQLEVLRAALDNVEQGIILLDADLNAQFMNRAVRALWKVSDAQADERPAYADLVSDARRTGAYGVPLDELEDYIARRIARVRAGDPQPMDVPVGDGRVVRAQCAVLPGGGRMLTYVDVTDLVRQSQQLERLATTDGLTGVFNRRHFMTVAEAEWNRFQRYHRPMSLLVIDIDRFKSVNDRFGHDVGDRALVDVANLCKDGRRSSDIVARIGGEEFAILLPETELSQAGVVAERLRENVNETPFSAEARPIALTVSIGVAQASVSMSGIDALMKLADRALYEAKARGRNRVVHGGATQSFPLGIAAE